MVTVVSSRPSSLGDAALPGIIGDFVRSFLGWAELLLSWVLGGRCDSAQDKVSNVESSELHHLVVILGHLLLVCRHLLGCSISRFVQVIQVDSQLIVITIFMESLWSQAGDSFFDWNYYFSTIGETEGGLSYWGSCCSPICT